MRGESAKMNAIPSELNWSPAFDPFAPQFFPDRAAEGKSHFQSTLFIIPSQARRQALNDFYAYCRLVDDIADSEELGLSPATRNEVLNRIETWIRNPVATESKFWNRFKEAIERYSMPLSALIGIIAGVRYDLKEKPLRFETWDDLNQYVRGVACAVGEVVLAILGETSPRATDYALNMGRCLQYLNIMRDIDEDFKQRRIYIPLEFLKKIGASEGVRNGTERPSAETKASARVELYDRAIQYRRKAVPLSWRCLPAELMAGVYLKAASTYWRFGKPQRLTKVEKLKAIGETTYRFIFRRKSLTY